MLAAGAQVLLRLCAAVSDGRAQAQRLLVLALHNAPDFYNSLATQSGCQLYTLDGFTDPWHWNQ
jgi:hypothetical protein